MKFVTRDLPLILLVLCALLSAADGTVDTKTAMFIGAAYTNGTATSGSSTTVFTASGLANSSKGPFTGMYLYFSSGTAENQFEMRKISAFDSVTGRFTLSRALSKTPAANDKFNIYNPTFTARKARLVSTLENYTQENIGLSKYGGRLDKRTTATGYFHAYKASNGRWWTIDPDGYYFENIGVASVNQGGSTGEVAAANSLWSSKQEWANDVSTMLKDNGFNGAGAWSDTVSLRASTPRVAYTMIWNFMSGYGKQRGGTTTQPGHTGYPNDCIFVFDPEFKTYCDSLGTKIAATKSDPYLVGHFSDNELPFKYNALNKYLTLPTTDYGYKAAKAWMDARHPGGWSASSLSVTDQQDFLGYVVDKYMSICSAALKKYDPNHMYLGSRFYGDEKGIKQAWAAAGKYCEVISLNLYGSYTPYLDNWGTWSGRPIVITEWYAMALDSGLPCTSGAGFVVETQKERGYYYQNFALGLLQSHYCVGWHYFMYQDNDPTNLNTDPSNRTGNKGIVSNRYVVWTTLLGMMKELNTQAYSLIDHFDGVTSTTPKYTLTVNSGSGDGSYTSGTVVTITANAAPTGQVFDQWTGATVANKNATTTTITMPAASTTVTAIYKQIPPTNQPPAISSRATANPNPASTGQSVTFTVAAADPDGQTLTYHWTFGDGTTGSGSSTTHSYAAAGTFSAEVTVSDGTASVKSSVSVSVVSFPSSVKINFQLAGAATPNGYLADTGKPIADRGNGFTYGWNADTSTAARDRNSPLSPDQRYDTLIHMQKPENSNAIWRIKVPNGDYTVRIVCGDPSHIDSVFKVVAEGVLTVDGIPTSTKHWIEGTKTVKVADGVLTITNGTGAKNNKICFIEISRAAVAARSLDRSGGDDDEVEFKPMNVTSIKGVINPGSEGHDMVSVSALLDQLPADFKPAGVAVGVDALGAIANFTLDKSGRGRSDVATCSLKYSKSLKAWQLVVTMKKVNWSPNWKEGGLNSDEKLTAANIPFGIKIGDQTFGGERSVMCSKQGKVEKIH